MILKKLAQKLKVIFSQVTIFFPGELGNLLRQW
jgi:hypothetical protein